MKTVTNNSASKEDLKSLPMPELQARLASSPKSRHLLPTEKHQAIDSFRQSILNQEIYEKFLADIDARLLQLESGEDEKTIEEPQSGTGSGVGP